MAYALLARFPLKEKARKKPPLGEAADASLIGSISQLVKQEAAVEVFDQPLTMHFGPREILLVLNVRFREGLSTASIEQAVDRLEGVIRRNHPEVKKIYVEANSKTAARQQPVT